MMTSDHDDFKDHPFSDNLLLADDDEDYEAQDDHNKTERRRKLEDLLEAKRLKDELGDLDEL